MQHIEVAPQVAQNKAGRASVVPDQLVAGDDCAISQQKPKCIERGFAWGKFFGSIHQVMVRGIKKVGQVFVMKIAAYNLVRMLTLGQVHLQGWNERQMQGQTLLTRQTDTSMALSATATDSIDRNELMALMGAVSARGNSAAC